MAANPDVLYQAFHAHLDACQQCAEHPFALCAEGHAALMAWGQADQRANLAARAADQGLDDDPSLTESRFPEEL